MDKIVCVGKNYLEHAKELGDAVPERPVLFLKPPSILRQAHAWSSELVVAAPAPDRGELHYECEIVLRLSRDLDAQAPVARLEEVVDAVTLGLDMTLRDLQAAAKKAGHPWTRAKVFPDAALIGPWIPLRDFPEFLDVEFSLELGDAVRQRARGSQMRWAPIELIRDASSAFPLRAGDAFFTGTPAGVGPVAPGDRATLRWNQRAFSVRWQRSST